MNIIIIINSASFLVSHRMKIIEALLKNNYSITVVCGSQFSQREQRDKKLLRQLGVNVVCTKLHGGSLNIFREISVLFTLINLVIRIRPSIIHGISPKGVLCACLVALIFRKCKLVLSFSGLGQLYTQKSFIFNIIRTLYEALLRISVKRKDISLIVQNLEDKNFLIKKTKCNVKRITLLPGSGVDLNDVTNVNFDSKENIVLFPARVIPEKGIREFILASNNLKNKYVDWRFLVAGSLPQGLSKLEEMFPELDISVLDKIDFLGHVDDIFELFRKSKIVCLPSYYREGLPLALAEASVHGCAIVTTDNVGCRDTVLPGKTGILVPVKDEIRLTDALDSLMSDANLLAEMSENAHAFGRTRFDVGKVVLSHLEIYNDRRY